MSEHLICTRCGAVLFSDQSRETGVCADCVYAKQVRDAIAVRKIRQEKPEEGKRER